MSISHSLINHIPLFNVHTPGSYAGAEDKTCSILLSANRTIKRSVTFGQGMHRYTETMPEILKKIRLLFR